MVDLVTGAASVSSSAQTASSTLTSDFSTFLKMLTAQIQNQDPLNPIDSSDYAVQLATFSSVEQQLRTNDLLAKLIEGQGSGGLGSMASWIGKEARARVDVSLSGGEVEVVTPWANGAESADLVVRDSAGRLVDRVGLKAGQESLLWSSDGLPHGTYSFVLESYSGETLLGQDKAEVYARISEVQLSEMGPVLVFEGGNRVDAAAITALRS